MIHYKNTSGNSNVESYEINDSSIIVRFTSGRQRNYLYNVNRPGTAIIKQMKQFAIQGHGLNSFISNTVKSNFSKKW